MIINTTSNTHRIKTGGTVKSSKKPEIFITSFVTISHQSYYICQNEELHTIVNISTHVAGYQKSCRAHQAGHLL